MPLPNELSGLHGMTCSCGAELALQVCSSAAGYYLGYHCGQCGPGSRETGYYHRSEFAAIELVCVRHGLKPFKMRQA